MSMHPRLRFVLNAGTVGTVVGLALAACSAPSGGNNTFQGGGAGSGQGGSGQGGDGQGGSAAGFNDGGLGIETSTSDQGLSADSSCATTSQDGKQAPLDLFIMLDQSGSMQGTKWTTTVQALTAFVNDPAATGIGVGLQYFGLPPGGGGVCPPTCGSDADCAPCGGTCFPILFTCIGGGGGTDSCSAADYAKAEVPIAPLPGNANAVVASLGAHAPSTSTPTSAALDGAIQYAKGWAAAHTDHKTVVVFATDGDPTECNTDLNFIAGIASAGYTGTPSIPTYVINMPGATKSALDQWAAAGGTSSSYDATNTATFVAAMNAIRGTALSCDFFMPTSDGGTVDVNKVNVNYTPSNGPTQELNRVANAAACDPVTGGWYYDDNTNPTHIIICQTTCDSFKSDQGNGKVDIILGCVSKGTY